MKKLLLSLACVAGFTALPASAQVLISVDFNLLNNPNSLTQAGFTGLDLPGTGTTPSTIQNPSITVNGITATLPGTGIAARYSSSLDSFQSPGGFSNADLMEDFVTQLTRTTATAGASATDPLRIEQAKTLAPTNTALTLTGLTPDTAYTIRLWSLDVRASGGSNAGTIFAWWDTTNGTGASATQIGWVENQVLPNVGGLLTNNEAFSVFGIVTANANGEIRIGNTVSGSSGALNGFELAVVPEPQSIALLLGAGAFLVIVRLRRRSPVA